LWLCLLLSPLLLLLASNVPVKGGFWWNCGIAAGFVALAMLVLQFFLTARLRTCTRPFGIDLIYCFHRQIALVFCLVLLLHPLLLLHDIALWRALAERWDLQSGALAFLLLLLLMLTSVWRKVLFLPYQHWRRLHLALALLAAALALAHVRAVGYYSAAPALQVFW
jgi:predicted ferric reductase